MIAQSKGKDLSKVPVSKLENKFYASIKYDGHYVQIHKEDGVIKFFTSGGKEFYIDYIAEELIALNKNVDFIIECEYIANTDGKLGSRGKAAKLTTYRTDFQKGLKSNTTKGTDNFKVFDCLSYFSFDSYSGYGVEERPFNTRLVKLVELNLGSNISLPEFKLGTLEECKELAKSKVKKGFEGLYLKSPHHMYKPGKRVNDAIKLKLRPTADLLCIMVNSGEGKYIDMIGSLTLQDSQGRLVSVGSGLSDAQRDKPLAYYINKVVEIEYEQILDTYIQPTFVGIREDKSATDID